MEQMLPLADAAILADVRPDTLRQAILDGRLTAEKFGRLWWIDRDELERYIRDRRPGGRPRLADSLTG